MTSKAAPRAMQTPTSPSNAVKALKSCVSCKIRKRKCDKRLPHCSLCLSKNWDCDYSRPVVSTQPGPRRSPHGRDDSTTLSSTAAGEDERLRRADFPAVFFLDWDVFKHREVDIPRAGSLVPVYVMGLIGNTADIRAFASDFFDTIHTWMPFVSKKRFYENLLDSSNPPRADLALLYLCMRLITWIPSDGQNDPYTPLYMAAKRYNLDTEMAGILSIQSLQAMLLISLYEIGHGIYPAAFMTIGSCARYGHALGINWNATSQIRKPFTWVELEERRRVWWAVVILDRLVNLGCPGRPFAAEDPSAEDLLPADDVAWDEGIMPSSQSFSISSSFNLDTGRFALVAQASRLLGQVLRHVSHPSEDKALHDAEETMLDSTLRALISVTATEGQIRQLSVCNQTSICYCALMALDEPYVSLSEAKSADPAHVIHAKGVMENISQGLASTSNFFLPGLASIVEEVSPFLLHLLYQSAAAFVRVNRETGSSESAQALEVLRKTMRILGGRWRAADAYLQILEAREVTYIC